MFNRDHLITSSTWQRQLTVSCERQGHAGGPSCYRPLQDTTRAVVSIRSTFIPFLQASLWVWWVTVWQFVLFCQKLILTFKQRTEGHESHLKLCTSCVACGVKWLSRHSVYVLVILFLSCSSSRLFCIVVLSTVIVYWSVLLLLLQLFDFYYSLAFIKSWNL